MTTSTRPVSFPLLLALVTLPLYLLDQATKWAVLRYLKEGDSPPYSFGCKALVVQHLKHGDYLPVIPGWFDLVHWRNTGAAFSAFSDSNAFFIGLSIVAAVVLGVLAWRGKFQQRASRVGWALLMAGILGNLTDRILHGSVVDFLLFDLHVPFAHPWPAFNVADSCIFLAAALFIWQSFWEPSTTPDR